MCTFIKKSFFPDGDAVLLYNLMCSFFYRTSKLNFIMKKKNLIAAGILLLSNVLFAFSFAAPLAPVHTEPVPLRKPLIYQPEPKCGPTIFLDNLPGYAVKRIAVHKTDFGTGAVTNWAFDFTIGNQPTYPYQLPSPNGGNYSVNVLYLNQDEVIGGSLYVIDNYPGQPGNQVACRSLGVHSLPVAFTATCETFTVTISNEGCH
jgi:hypothetical protein